MYVKFVYEGHLIKIKVTASEKREILHSRNVKSKIYLDISLTPPLYYSGGGVKSANFVLDFPLYM